MAFSVFQSQYSPIAIDFGASSVKVLQLGLGGDRPVISAAGELPIPDAIRSDQEKLIAFYAEYLPGLLNEGSFRGKRAVIGLPSSRTFIQHMHCVPVEGTKRLDLIKAQLQAKIGASPEGLVIRYRDVVERNIGAQPRHEVICLAIVRDLVMQYVEMLQRRKINVVGVHPETLALTNAYTHLIQDDADRDLTTMFVDLGWGGAQVAICRGEALVFARYIPIGGRHFDQRMAAELHCDIMAARTHRQTMGEQARRNTPGRQRPDVLETALLNAASDAWQNTRTSTTAVTAAKAIDAKVDLTELIDTLADELAGCVRYHAALMPGREVDRLIFVGGESRQLWLIRALSDCLGIPAFLGDPLLRMGGEPPARSPGVDLREPQPGWAVAAGLCTAPTDL